MTYEIEITPAAQRTIKKLPKNIQRKIIEIIELLVLEPRPVGVVKLSARKICIELEQVITESYTKYKYLVLVASSQ